MRRLPVFLMLDISDSMIGKAHQYLEKGLDDLTKKLRQDPHALETVYLSVIAFAGQVKTLVPLIDLPTFYPPRLPIGAGTALGAALNHLMSEIDHQVISTTPTRKGDWKPVVYLLTDGKPTDIYQTAIERWSKSYAKRSYVIAIGMGPYADTSVLSQFANEVLSYNGENETDFARFIQWMTLSVSVQSMAIENKTGGESSISLEKAGGVLELAHSSKISVDKDCVVLVGRCQQRKSPYLLKFERAPSFSEMFSNPDLLNISTEQQLFHISGCFPVEEDYFDWSGSSWEIQHKVNVNTLVGAAGCPYCGNHYAFGLCDCGRLFCVDGPGSAHCPWCSKHTMMGATDDAGGLEVTRSRG
jgi:uncharacterized protein YegL